MRIKKRQFLTLSLLLSIPTINYASSSDNLMMHHSAKLTPIVTSGQISNSAATPTSLVSCEQEYRIAFYRLYKATSQLDNLMEASSRSQLLILPLARRRPDLLESCHQKIITQRRILESIIETQSNICLAYEAEHLEDKEAIRSQTLEEVKIFYGLQKSSLMNRLLKAFSLKNIRKSAAPICPETTDEIEW